ncbi:hypothetical protein [Paraburkholderia sp. GAS348]|uniref:hypothetical protein n=1 Tax=Paraburkholderia sp. GAS348 TaxID=3035132 RepID=UPI003D1AE6FE
MHILISDDVEPSLVSIAQTQLTSKIKTAIPVRNAKFSDGFPSSERGHPKACEDERPPLEFSDDHCYDTRHPLPRRQKGARVAEFKQIQQGYLCRFSSCAAPSSSRLA